MKVGLHQGSALSPLLFITVMDVISQEVGREPPHAMLFADDIVLCEKTREEAEEQLELWRKAIIRPTMTYGAECWTMKKKDEMLTNKTEMRMLRWIQGVSMREHKRNEEIRMAATVQPIATHLMQKRLRWYGHVSRRYDIHMTRTVLDMVVEGVKPRGRPNLRYMDTIRRDIKKNALTDVNILNRKDWRLAVSRAAHLYCSQLPTFSKSSSMIDCLFDDVVVASRCCTNRLLTLRSQFTMCIVRLST